MLVTVLGTPYVTSIRRMFISAAGSYGLAIHMTHCVFDDFPLFGSSSTPNSTHCSVHSTHHRLRLNPLQSFTILQLSNDIIGIRDPYQPLNNNWSSHTSLKGHKCNKQLAITPPSLTICSIIGGTFLSSLTLCVTCHVTLSLSTPSLPDLHIHWPACSRRATTILHAC